MFNKVGGAVCDVCKVLWKITLGAINEVAYAIKFNMRYVAALLVFAMPYAMYMLGQWRYANMCVCGAELTPTEPTVDWLIPLLVYVVVYYIREIANRVGAGSNMPLPTKRFTSVDEYGEVSIENNRLQELLLYIADLEDWLHRKAML